MPSIKLFQIFRTGRHIDGNGIPRDFTESHLQGMAAAYSPKPHPAPLVLGHPENQDAAQQFGEVARLIVKGRALYALAKVSDVLVYWVRAGHYRYVSPSFSLAHSSLDSAAKYSLRHVGFLGAMPPAVKGMPALAFGERGTIVSTTEVTAGLFDAPAEFKPPTNLRRSTDTARLELHLAAIQMQLTCPALTYAEALGLVESVAPV